MVFALDLSLVIPLFIVDGIWLWQRQPWGYVLAVIGTLTGAVYLVGLCAATWTEYQAGATCLAALGIRALLMPAGAIGRPVRSAVVGALVCLGVSLALVALLSGGLGVA